MSARPPVSSSKDAVPAKEIPDFITDTNTGKKYEKGKFLGKVSLFDSYIHFISLSVCYAIVL